MLTIVWQSQFKKALKPLSDVVHTLTADNGKEFAMHEQIASTLKLVCILPRHIIQGSVG